NNSDAATAYNLSRAYGVPVEDIRQADLGEFVGTLDDSEEQWVSRQLVRYWRNIFIEHEGKQAATVSGLKEARKLIQPSPTDDIGGT
ncbi:hypothetical protein NL339_27210, partial [Klebsiella pneumoniae]|nr:hypothetical protein [Klebsiella pneumoniae]